MPKFEVIEHEAQKMIKVELEGDTVRAEAGALHYHRGNISMTSAMPTASGMLSSVLSGEKVFRPTYTGHGEVVFGPPIFGEYVILDLHGEAWVLDRGAYVCSDEAIEVSMISNKASAALLGGEGLFQTQVKGHGKVVIQAPGRVQQVQLESETLAVDGTFAVARTGSIDFSVRRSSSSLVGSMTSGEGLINHYSGSGLVLLAPVPNLYQAMIDAVAHPFSAPATGGGFSLGRGVQGILGVIVAIFVALFFVCSGIIGILMDM